MAGNCLAMPSNHKAPMLVHNSCCQLLAFKTKHRRQDKSWLSSYKISSTGLHLPMVNFSASGVLFTVLHLDKTSETKMLFLVFLGGDQSLSLYLNPPSTMRDQTYAPRQPGWWYPSSSSCWASNFHIFKSPRKWCMCIIFVCFLHITYSLPLEGLPPPPQNFLRENWGKVESFEGQN